MSLDFTTLENRYCFKGEIVLEQAAHIGSGFEGDNVDSTFTATKDRRMYLPGSSIRGALRSTVERILLTLDKPTCLLFSPALAIKNKIKCLTARPDIVADMKNRFESQDQLFQDAFYELLEKEPEQICHTCRVFGSPYFASKTKISDATQKDNEKPGIRYGTGINRETGTVEKGALYSMEVVEKDRIFPFELIAENMSDDDLGVLAVGLTEMVSGNFWIGAKSAAGLGRCRLKIEVMNYFDGKERKLADYLLEKDSNKKYLQKEKDDALKKLRSWVESYIKPID